jgi:hypothetical protein
LHDTEPSAGNAEAAASRLALAEQRYTRAVAEADASHELTIDDGVGVFDELGVRRSTANAMVCLGTTLSEFPVMAMAKLQMSATANISDRANAMMTVLTKVELIDLLTMVT